MINKAFAATALAAVLAGVLASPTHADARTRRTVRYSANVIGSTGAGVVYQPGVGYTDYAYPSYSYSYSPYNSNPTSGYYPSYGASSSYYNYYSPRANYTTRYYGQGQAESSYYPAYSYGGYYSAY